VGHAALRPLLSSARRDWNTPLNVLELVRAIDTIGLDPCGNATSLVQPTVEYRIDRGQDGLALPWTDPGLVFCNPPYGRGIGAWTKRASELWVKQGVESILLVPARTDAKWWQDTIRHAVICFWRGRLRFVGAPAPAPFPSALLYHGHRPHRFRELFAPVGWIVPGD